METFGGTLTRNVNNPDPVISRIAEVLPSPRGYTCEDGDI